MDDKVTFETGETVSKKDFLDLQAEVIKDEISEGAFLLNDVHFDCTSGERQVFKWVDHLFSPVTANLFRQRFKDHKARQELADLIETLSELKKILTSKKSDANSDDPAKQALGLHPEYQFGILKKAYHYFETMTYGRNYFQEGAMLTINGILGLLEHLKTCYGVDHLFTIFLTQDFLERFFGLIRGMGNFDPNPSPQQFMYRLQTAITIFFLKVKYQ